MRRFRKSHLIIVLALSVALSPPVKATYQDSIILQFLIESFNYIVENVNKIGFYLETLTKRVGDTALINATEQSTEVTSGVVAEGTKTLGGLEYLLEFGGNVQTRTSGGRSFHVSALSSMACVTLSQNKKRKQGEQRAIDVSVEFKEYIEAFKLPKDISLNDMLDEMKRIEHVMFEEKQGLNVTSPGNNVSDKDIGTAPQAIAMVANKKAIPKDAGYTNEELGGENSFELYRMFTGVVEGVMTSNFVNSVSFDGGASMANKNKAMSVARRGSYYARANNLKTGKGRSADMVEGQYTLLAVRLEQLDELRKQQRLYAVQALRKLRDFHEGI